MHLVPEDEHPHEHSDNWFRRLRDQAEAWMVDILARALSNPNWGDGWRIDLDGLVDGEARIVCSVLYWPADEFDLDSLEYDAPPEPAYFADLKRQLEFVSEHLAAEDPDGRRHRIARRGEGL